MMAKVYAYQNNLTSRLNSASGGAFSALVNAWITECNFMGIPNEKLSVYGAAFDDAFEVRHIRCNISDWDKLRGSKYVPSDFAGIFDLIENDLNSGCNVLFSGTPCQVAAVKKHIENKNWERNRFFLIDIICHGTPERAIWDDYKKYIESTYGGKLTKYSFRYKGTHSAEPIVYAEFSNGRIVKDSKELRSYMDLYFTYLPLKSCCYKCPFSDMNRVSDITIGDFWGAEVIFKGLNIKKGISQVIVNSDLGNKIFSGIGNCDGEMCIECKSNEFLKYQHNLVSPTQRPSDVDEFWRYYKDNGYEAAIHKYVGSGKAYAIKFAVKRILSYLGVKQKLKRIIK